MKQLVSKGLCLFCVLGVLACGGTAPGEQQLGASSAGLGIDAGADAGDAGQ